MVAIIKSSQQRRSSLSKRQITKLSIGFVCIGAALLRVLLAGQGDYYSSSSWSNYALLSYEYSYNDDDNNNEPIQPIGTTTNSTTTNSIDATTTTVVLPDDDTTGRTTTDIIDLSSPSLSSTSAVTAVLRWKL